jgi:hypothetical protein
MNAAWLIDRCLRHKAAESPYILGKRVEKVMELHRPLEHRGNTFCSRCVPAKYPCDTVRILNGEDL